MRPKSPAFTAEVLDLMLDAVCLVDRDGAFIFVSAAFESMFGYAPTEVIGKPMIDLVHPEDRGRTLHVVDTIMRGGQRPHFENRWVRKDGRVIHVMWSARWSDELQARVAVAHDITDLKMTEEHLRHLAGHDSLTDLPNRARILDRLQAALSAAIRDQSLLSLLFIDLDDFKLVNDQYGHLVGDQLLRTVAERLHGSVRQSDMVGRFGGDEFLVLLTDMETLDVAIVVADKIRTLIDQPFVIGDHQLHVTASIGIANFPEHGQEMQQLIQFADHAMYQAKSAGGTGVTPTT